MKNSILNALNTISALKAGTLHTVTYQKEVKPAALYKNNVITKQTKMSFRTGVRYANLSAVKRRREIISEHSEKSRTPWWGWLQGFEHRVKYKLSDPTQLYLNICPTPKTKIKTVYTINGKPASKEEVMLITPPSMWNNNECDTLDISLDNIIEIK